MKSTGRDLSKKVPRLSDDPGCYDRSNVVGAGDPTPDQEWAGNKPGWQGMPKALGSTSRGFQEQSHASEGSPSGGPVARGTKGKQSDSYAGDFAGNNYGEDGEQGQL